MYGIYWKSHTLHRKICSQSFKKKWQWLKKTLCLFYTLFHVRFLFA
jgi:hypothetical protein